jgi:hypothetical protein
MGTNRCTLTLAGTGIFIFICAARAEEKPSPVMAALSSTTISGYASASGWWIPGTGNANLPTFAYGGAAKADGFNLDVVKLSIERPLDEYPFSAGFKFDALFGPDANALGTTSTGFDFATSDFAIKQAYVAVGVPVGNGINFRLGVWDAIIGYETFDAGNNAHYTRSYGYTIEPTTHTGLLGTWQVNEVVSVAAGVANTFGPTIGDRAHPPFGPKAESYKTYMGSIILTAPRSTGFFQGSTVAAGVINGYNSGTGVDQTSYYLGGAIATPLRGLKIGASFDYVDVHRQDLTGDQNFFAGAYAVYLSFQATEKLSFHARGEYANNDVPGVLTPLDANRAGTDFDNSGSKVLALTGTIQYDLWKNVLSRLEVRWDHAADGSRPYGGTAELDQPAPGTFTGGGNKANSFLVAANLVYKF